MNGVVKYNGKWVGNADIDCLNQCDQVRDGRITVKMNIKQNNYLNVPTINTQSSPPNNNINELNEDIHMVSDGSQSPYFSTDDDQSNNSSNSNYTQVSIPYC